MKRLTCSADANTPINLSTGKARSIASVLEIFTEYLPETRDHIIDHGVRDAFEASCADLTKLGSSEESVGNIRLYPDFSKA